MPRSGIAEIPSDISRLWVVHITGADATACVKSTCFNMIKAGYTVHVISDCVTSYDLKKIPEMLSYYADKGCEVKDLALYNELASVNKAFNENTKVVCEEFEVVYR